jgi:hypothetical protein
MPNLPLTDDEEAALTGLLRQTIENERYRLAPRLRIYRAILAKLEPPQPIAEPYPPPRAIGGEPTHFLSRKKRRR